MLRLLNHINLYSVNAFSKIKSASKLTDIKQISHNKKYKMMLSAQGCTFISNAWKQIIFYKQTLQTAAELSRVKLNY